MEIDVLQPEIPICGDCANGIDDELMVWLPSLAFGDSRSCYFCGASTTQGLEVGKALLYLLKRGEE